jgi:G protein-coupled receptor 64/G protein-coupled receptor 126
MDADLLENLICFLGEEHYVWLAAERKLAGGPIYYSGPVASDFNYNFNDTEEYNVSWIQSDYNVNNKCLALNIVQKELQVLSCESTLPFVCLFPSEFWTHNITYDSFHIYHENCSGDYKLEGGIPWEDVREKCRQNGGDLINKQSSYFRNDLYSSKANTIYIGKHNTEKPNSDSSLQCNFTQWIGSEIEKVYHIYNTGFQLDSINEAPKEYACLPAQSLAVPKVYIDEINVGNYVINTYNIEEASYLYGIKCYLNGKCVKSDELPRLSITQQGYLFCEVLMHLPILLLKSNVILVQNSEVLTFACQVFDPNQNYDSKLHDFSLHSESVGSNSYYRKLLNEKLSGFEISIQNISASSYSSGIYIDFHIELFSPESKLEEIYVNISSIMLPSGKEVEIGSRKLPVSYIRSTKYCMEEIMNIESNSTNFTTVATWPATVISKTIALQQCVTHENEVLTRSCLGDFNTGATWGPVKKLFPHSNSKLEFYVCEDVLHSAKKLINDTVKSIKKNLEIYNTLDIYNTTNKFIRHFETLFVGKNVNDTCETDDGPVSIYSMSLQHDILRFMYKGNGNRLITNAVDNSENEEDVTIVIHLIPNITTEYKNNVSLLISVFQNTTLFPQKADNLILSSPVVLINVTNETNIQFPIKVSFSSEIDIKSGEEIMCAFWNEETNKWNVGSSKYNGTTRTGLHECLYYYMSCFALLFRADNKEHLVILNILSRAGCYLSLTGLALVLLTFLFFHKWRLHLESKITASLSVSLFVMYLVFVTGFTQTSNEFLCISIAATLHYFILASFCWMLVEAFYNYLKFVKVIGTYVPRFMWKASAGAWGCPLIPVIAVFCYNYKLYKDEQYCWVHSEAFYYAFLTPLAVICGANIVIFIIILNSITCARQHFKTNQQQYSLLISQLNASFCIFTLLGLSWTFGFLTLIGTGVIFNYLFCITSTLQGFLIFVYFISLGMRGKGMWCKLFGRCCVPKNNTYTDKTQTSNLRSLAQTSSEL